MTVPPPPALLQPSGRSSVGMPREPSFLEGGGRWPASLSPLGRWGPLAVLPDLCSDHYFLLFAAGWRMNAATTSLRK